MGIDLLNRKRWGARSQCGPNQAVTTQKLRFDRTDAPGIAKSGEWVRMMGGGIIVYGVWGGVYCASLMFRGGVCRCTPDR